MRFFYDLAAPPYLFVALACGALVVAFAALLILASLRRARAVKAFGEPSLVGKLESFDAAGRRLGLGDARHRGFQPGAVVERGERPDRDGRLYRDAQRHGQQ